MSEATFDADHAAGDATFFDPITTADCAECGYPMMLLRTETASTIGTLARMECTACEARGTIETRPKDSVAQQTGVKYHGAAVAEERDQ